MTETPAAFFQTGFTFAEYLPVAARGGQIMAEQYGEIVIGPQQQDFFRSLAGQGLKLLVITESWCGDGLMNTPILARVCELAAIDMRIFPRDSHLDLMDQFLTGGKRSIPVMAFYDRNMAYLGRWGPRSAAATAYRSALLAAIPVAKDHPDYAERQKEAFVQVREGYRTRDFRSETLRELQELLAQFTAGKTSAGE